MPGKTIKLFGHQVKKSTAIAGGVVTVGLVGVIYYRHKQTNAANASTANPTGAIDPATGFPYGSAQDTAALAAQQTASTANIDPSTGYPYGSVQDQQALSAQEAGAGSVAASGTTGADSNVDPLTGYTAGSAQDVAQLRVLYGSTTAAATTAATTTGTGTSDTGTTDTGTGTSDTGTGTTDTGTGTTTTPTPAPTPTPVTTPKPVAAAKKTFPLPAGRSDTPYTTYVDLGWTKVTGASQYHYQVLTSSGATQYDGHTTATSARVSGLKAKTSYRWRMAVDSTATENNSPWSSPVAFTTK